MPAWWIQVLLNLICVNFVSNIQADLRWGRSYSLEDARHGFSRWSFPRRIKAISVPLPHTIKTMKHSIAKIENIEDRTNTSLFLSPYSQSPMREGDKFTIRNCIGLGSTLTPSPRCKDVRFRTKRLGVRKEGWTYWCCRAWYIANESRDPTSYVHSTLSYSSYSY